MNNSKSNNNRESNYDNHIKRLHAEAEDDTNSYGLFNSCHQHRHSECKQVLPKFASNADFICTCPCHTKKADDNTCKHATCSNQSTLLHGGYCSLACRIAK